MRIRIETRSDTHHCDDCGVTLAEGGKVFVDDVLVVEREPVAHCYGAHSFSDAELLVLALNKLGHTVEVDGSKYHISSNDDEYYPGPKIDAASASSKI